MNILAQATDINNKEFYVYINSKFDKFPNITTGKFIYKINNHQVTEEIYQKLIKIVEKERSLQNYNNLCLYDVP